MLNTNYWFAVHVRSNSEFVTETELEKRHMEVYLPSISQWRQWHDRKKLIRTPLFPGYLFVNMNPNNDLLVNVLKTRGVVSILGIQGAIHSTVPDEEISNLRKMVTNGQELSVSNSLGRGARVRIRSGALEGMEGILTGTNRNTYEITMNIEIIGRSVSVRLHSRDIVAI